jgi:hydantoinase/carbamoylase family amidase
LRDANGLTLHQVLVHLGLDAARLPSVRRKPGDYSAYLELHIEQGRVLEESGARLGVVEAIAAPTRLRVDITGRSDHSGATPMSLRRDALSEAAEIILAVERIARDMPPVVATVGIIRAEPNVMNVVPGRVELGIDIRSTDLTRKSKVAAVIHQQIGTISEARGLQFGVCVLSDEAPVTLAPKLVEVLESRAVERDIRILRMSSGAGHDAMQMARICPAGMLMIPSRAGISHNREEWTPVEDVALGIQVLLDSVVHVSQEGMSV